MSVQTDEDRASHSQLSIFAADTCSARSSTVSFVTGGSGAEVGASPNVAGGAVAVDVDVEDSVVFACGAPVPCFFSYYRTVSCMHGEDPREIHSEERDRPSFSRAWGQQQQDLGKHGAQQLGSRGCSRMLSVQARAD